MFTGLIEEVGAVSRRSGADMAILAEHVLDDLKEGDSVAVDGACLTVVAVNHDNFVVQMSPETIERTTLSALRPGSAVNLERAMAANGRFGGHMVLGHVDGIGRIHSVQPQGDFSLWRFQAPADVTKYVVPKGSITVDGISLTVMEPAADTFGVAIIPTTLSMTTLGKKRPGDSVNLEADIVGKHVYHYLNGKTGGSLSLETLARNGYV
ncbi:MAG: riboflavin synthase [bacterium]|nr:riboflavin synthase [bacterium]